MDVAQILLEFATLNAAEVKLIEFLPLSFLQKTQMQLWMEGNNLRILKKDIEVCLLHFDVKHSSLMNTTCPVSWKHV